MSRWVDADELARLDREKERRKAGVRSAAGYRVDCPNCGRYWSPSMMESTSYPGSACDTGGCEDEREDS